MAKSSVSMKLLIDTQERRVLFAEASKDCVDFLFYILSLPVATVIKLLKKKGMVGSLANLYGSVENLNESYIQPNQSKATLLEPVAQVRGSSVPLLLLNKGPAQIKFYRCGYCIYEHRISDDPRAVCPNCHNCMTTSVPYVAPPAAQHGSSAEGGFVKGLVTYMVMDNLVVRPMSTISSITLLNMFNVKDVSKLEERVVDISMDEAVNLLKASLQSYKVLTDVFVEGKGAAA